MVNQIKHVSENLTLYLNNKTTSPLLLESMEIVYGIELLRFSDEVKDWGLKILEGDKITIIFSDERDYVTFKESTRIRSRTVSPGVAYKIPLVINTRDPKTLFALHNFSLDIKCKGYDPETVSLGFVTGSKKEKISF
ncbi:MAG: hypothetical protein ACFFD4_40740, partial [Candidatus Odinarchaeota archaeon]